MDKIRLYDIIKACDASFGLNSDLEITDISTDTRTISEGSLFVALKGSNFDGHEFAKDAVSKGAVAVVGERKIEGVKTLIVDSCNKALMDIAAFYRDTLPAFTVAVTGSVGKTTTKDFISLVLSKKYKTYKTQGNLNNEIGVPKTLFSMDKSYGAGVIEMGMNHAGELSRISRAVKPDMVVITNIGYSHIENLGSKENILKAKLEALDYAKPSAPLVVCADDKLLCNYESFSRGREVLTYSLKSKNSAVYAKNIKENESGVSFDIVYGGSEYKASLCVLGSHNVLNALCAFCIGRYFGVEACDIIEALAEYKPSGLRQNVSQINGVTLIADCYNASPDSMKSALSVLSATKTEGKKIAVLGDMLELGNFSVKLHKKVGEYVTRADVDMLLCIGNDAKEIANTALGKTKSVLYFENKCKAVEFLNENLSSGDTILFKASRGMRLEEIINSLEILKDKQ